MGNNTPSTPVYRTTLHPFMDSKKEYMHENFQKYIDSVGIYNAKFDMDKDLTTRFYYQKQKQTAHNDYVGVPIDKTKALTIKYMKRILSEELEASIERITCSEQSSTIVTLGTTYIFTAHGLPANTTY